MVCWVEETELGVQRCKVARARTEKYQGRELQRELRITAQYPLMLRVAEY